MGKLKAKDRDAIVELVMRKYKTNPAAVEATLPEVAQLLRKLFCQSKRKSSWDIFRLTLKEEEERWRSWEFYSKQIERMGSNKPSLSKEEAIKALEDAAVLAGSSLKASLKLNRKTVIKLIRAVSSLSLSKKGKTRTQIFREGELASSVNLLKGVQLHLTWDKKLLSIEVNPKELRLRDKAFKFVGIAEDKLKDTAKHHDKYLAEGLSGV